MFYLFAMVSIIVCLWLAWKPICELNSMHWQMINALLRDSEICFAWCQSLAFLLVARNLYEVKAMTSANWTSFSAEKYTKTINWMLFIGLAISNAFLVIFLAILAFAKNTNAQKFFVHLEIASWLLGTFSTMGMNPELLKNLIVHDGLKYGFAVF